VTIEIEDLEREITRLRGKLQSAVETVKPLTLPTAPLTQEAQSVLKAAKTWGTTLKGWLSKLSLLDAQDRLSVLHAIIKSPQEKQATAYMFAALSSELPQEEIAAIVNEMVRRVTLSEDFDYKANFMAAVPVDVLRLASSSFLISFFRDAIDIMNRDQFKEVNKVTPAVIKIQEAVPEALMEEYVKALLSQAISSANTGGPAARKAALALPEKWAILGLQCMSEVELLWMSNDFYKDFLQKYVALWPDDKHDLFQDYLTLSNREMVKKYQHDDDE